MTGPGRPVLAIVYGPGSASPMSLSESASSLCDIAWVVDSGEIGDASMLRLLRKLGQTIDIAGMTDAEAADSVRRVQPEGIVAYADAQIGTASALGESLGLDYYGRPVAERLLDKVSQRSALGLGGLPVPRCVVVPPHPSPDEVDAVAASVEFPVVLKPRHGAASRETHLARNAAELRNLIAEPSVAESQLDMVVEEYMDVSPSAPSPYFGDYVSVESVVAHGDISHLAVTGRLPSAKPFRETGLIIPSDFAPSLVSSILGVATDAITALGIRTGCLHTEIKVTDKGLRVIEVNGRIGGFVAPVLSLASPGVDFFQISQRVALGEHVVFETLVPTDHVGYVIVGQPPLGARRVVSVTGLDRVADHPGVSSVSLTKRPGDEVDWRKGSHEYVYSVLGIAPAPDDVRALREFIDEEVAVIYE
jgi:D-alanine-D-alanine ligase-like ATP-grasp enzyme